MGATRQIWKQPWFKAADEGSAFDLVAFKRPYARFARNNLIASGRHRGVIREGLDVTVFIAGDDPAIKEGFSNTDWLGG